MEQDLSASHEAGLLYRDFVTKTGYRPPETYADMLLFAELSGAPVCSVVDVPADFWGVQIGEWIYVSGEGGLTDRERMHVLAHEWCHWLRGRGWGRPPSVQFYAAGCPDNAPMSRCQREESIARAFERLF